MIVQPDQSDNDLAAMLEERHPRATTLQMSGSLSVDSKDEKVTNTYSPEAQTRDALLMQLGCEMSKLSNDDLSVAVELVGKLPELKKIGNILLRML